MSKAENIVDIINAGVRAETLRQKAIANNIANLETPGYRRIDVKFEELDLNLETSEISDIPFLWGSEVQVRVWR